MLAGIGRLLERQSMRNDPGRFCPASVNQIAQVPVVVLDVGLPGANRLPFEPEESHVKSDLTLLGELVGTARVFGQENADNADSAVKRTEPTRLFIVRLGISRQCGS
jgi:hypothetical protein